jgi:catechol 2,3-dioxygenase-like lactoylglutathione lyase family enzyme
VPALELRGLHHVTCITADAQACVDFYRRAARAAAREAHRRLRRPQRPPPLPRRRGRVAGVADHLLRLSRRGRRRSGPGAVSGLRWGVGSQGSFGFWADYEPGPATRPLRVAGSVHTSPGRSTTRRSSRAGDCISPWRAPPAPGTPCASRHAFGSVRCRRVTCDGVASAQCSEANPPSSTPCWPRPCWSRPAPWRASRRRSSGSGGRSRTRSTRGRHSRPARGRRTGARMGRRVRGTGARDAASARRR